MKVKEKKKKREKEENALESKIIACGISEGILADLKREFEGEQFCSPGKGRDAMGERLEGKEEVKIKASYNPRTIIWPFRLWDIFCHGLKEMYNLTLCLT